MNDVGSCVGKPNINRSRRVQLIGKRCESVALHQAMSDQMGYKAKPLIKKAQRSYEAKERQDSYIDYKAEKRRVSSSTRGMTSCAPMSAPRCTMR